MNIAIAGGHGTIALHLTRMLSNAGHEVRSVIRKPEQTPEIEAAGGAAVVLDLEACTGAELALAIGEAAVVVFAAGAGPGSGAERKDTVDHQAAVKLIAAAETLGSDHYVMVSSKGADSGHEGDEVFDAYLRAKGRADEAVRDSAVGHTIIRPTSLTDDEPVGLVTLAASADGDAISRADVAAVLAAVIEAGPLDRTLELTAGPTPITEAVAAAA